MKASILLFLFCLICALSYGQGNIISVNNNAAAGADYTSLQTAIDSADAGDVIYIYPSASSYGDIAINRSITLIGPGYRKSENIQQLNIANASGDSDINTITLSTGGNGVSIKGLKIYRILATDINNLEFSRNWVEYLSTFTNASNIKVSENIFTYGAANQTTLTFGTCTSILLSHNIFSGFNGGSRYTQTSYSLVTSSTDASILNNMFTSRTSINNSVVENNIFLSFSGYSTSYNRNIFNSSNNTIRNNIFGFADNYGDTTNVVSIPRDDIFAGFPDATGYSFDSRYQLSPNSPARGAGTNGTDCGPFGGDTPYQLSGLPPIPLIYDIQAPATGTAAQGLQVTIKARAIN